MRICARSIANYHTTHTGGGRTVGGGLECGEWLLGVGCNGCRGGSRGAGGGGCMHTGRGVGWKGIGHTHRAVVGRIEKAHRAEADWYR